VALNCCGSGAEAFLTTDGFESELARRLPLATAVLEAFGFAFEDAALEALYEANRGRCYTGVLEFPRFIAMLRDCLLEHGGSGHRMCAEARRGGTLEVDQSSFYRKLANMPVAVSRALLRQCTARLVGLLPPRPVDLLPGCFEDFEVVVIDGKKVKNAARRLKPTRGFSGKLLGAKALVAMPLRSGLAVAMSDSLDGEANDVPLVPELLPQVRAVIGRRAADPVARRPAVRRPARAAAPGRAGGGPLPAAAAQGPDVHARPIGADAGDARRARAGGGRRGRDAGQGQGRTGGAAGDAAA
jgi:hypothetical protein